jgi:hypothetical protein
MPQPEQPAQRFPQQHGNAFPGEQNGKTEKAEYGRAQQARQAKIKSQPHQRGNGNGSYR